MPFRRETWGDGSELARWAYIAIVIVAAASMAILFVMIQDDRHSLTREASIRATQIQQQRYDTVYATCIDTNQRHDRTIRKLQALSADYIKKHPAQKSQIKANIQGNIALIDALVPKRNCKVVAKEAVHPLANPKGQ